METLPPPLPETFRSGYVAIVGWPNTGKSTFLNAILKFKLSIVSPKPQTTRDSMLGILTEKDMQMIFVDTPGWLSPQDAFQGTMKKAIVRAVYDDADALLWLVEPRALNIEEKQFVATLQKANKPVVVAVNKVDTLQGKPAVEALRQTLAADIPAGFQMFFISAKAKQGLEPVLQALKALLPLSPPYFPEGQITDRWERYFAAELIRERIFEMFRQEIPHACAVVIDEFIEKSGHKDVIRATLYVETEGQKQIVIGNKGDMIRNLGQKAREQIEGTIGRPVFLELKVKVKKNWRNDPVFLKQLSGE